MSLRLLLRIQKYMLPCSENGQGSKLFDAWASDQS